MARGARDTQQGGGASVAFKLQISQNWLPVDSKYPQNSTIYYDIRHELKAWQISLDMRQAAERQQQHCATRAVLAQCLCMV